MKTALEVGNREVKRPSHNTMVWSGQKINNWLIVEYRFTVIKRRHYLCRCVCGFEITKMVRSIVDGTSISCGCVNAINHTKHGLSKTKIYRRWKNIKTRCTNENCTQWKWYGGRGIKMCDRWLNSFESFYADMGDPPSNKHSIERVNNEGNYEPSNCKWATHKEQCNNRRKYTTSTRTN